MKETRSYPQFTVLTGQRRGTVLTFEYVTEAEYRRLVLQLYFVTLLDRADKGLGRANRQRTLAVAAWRWYGPWPWTAAT